MARKDRRPYTFHCTEKTPYRGGLRDGVSIVHSEAHQSHHNGRRQCKWCYADLGLNFERTWERESRTEGEREKANSEARAKADIIRRVSLTIDDRNGKKPEKADGNPRKEALVQVEAAS